MPPKGFQSVTVKQRLYDKIREIGQTLKPPKGPNQLTNEILEAWITVNAPRS